MEFLTAVGELEPLGENRVTDLDCYFHFALLTIFVIVRALLAMPSMLFSRSSWNAKRHISCNTIRLGGVMRILVAVILMTVVALYTTPMFAAETAVGKDLYTKKCASCHGAAGEGKDSVAKLFKVELKPLTSKEVQSMSDADLKKTILEGTGKMKPLKDVDAKGADDIVAYLRSLAKK